VGVAVGTAAEHAKFELLAPKLNFERPDCTSSRFARSPEYTGLTVPCSPRYGIADLGVVIKC